MESYIINGGYRLEGEVNLQGCKNSALPILAASVLNRGINIIHNVPNITDVRIMEEILQSIGCKVEHDKNTVFIDSSTIHNDEIQENLLRKMRSSIILMGSMLSSIKECSLFLPGGCDIGLRPIDIHLKTLSQLGSDIKEDHGKIICSAKELVGTNIQLDFPSVGATENIILASVFAKGVTSIGNAAKEPEIIDLQNFLNALGARVYGAGGNTVYVEGVDKLKRSVEYSVMKDRIVAGSIMCAAHMTKGEVFIKGCTLDTMRATYYKLLESNLDISAYSDGVLVKSDGNIKSIDSIITLPYPGFPTDMQSQLVAMLSVANGVSIVKETIFENRFKYTTQLLRMGADIKVNNQMAIVNGVKFLTPAKVYATDLRGGMALVLAGLCANGTTVVECSEYINRGYEELEHVFNALGGKIKSEKS